MEMNLAESPAVKLAQSLASSPSYELAKKLTESPSAKLARSFSLSSSTEIARKLAESPAVKLAQLLASSPSYELAKNLAESSAVKLAQSLASSPSYELAKKLAESPSAKLIQTLTVYSSKPSSRMPGVHSLLTQFREVQEDLNSGRLSLQGQFIYDGQKIESEKISQAFNSVLTNHIDDSTIVNFEVLLEKIYREIVNLKEPLYQNILTWLIMPIISGLIVLFIWNSSNFLVIGKEQKRQALKEITNTAINQVQENNILSDYRIVTANILNVRSAPNKQTRIVGNLHFGDLVKIVSKKKNWSKVTWESADKSTSITGWVFTRYIKKISR